MNSSRYPDATYSSKYKTPNNKKKYSYKKSDQLLNYINYNITYREYKIPPIAFVKPFLRFYFVNFRSRED